MLIVGIAGGTGSGKTTVVKKVMESLPCDEVIVIPQDSYYRDNRQITLEKRQKINFDHPDSVEFELLIDHLKQLKKGISVEMPVYSYLTCLRAKETITIKPAKVVLVEGILILADAGLRDILDIKVFVDADIIIPGGGENQVGIEVLISIIEKHLSRKKSKGHA